MAVSAITTGVADILAVATQAITFMGDNPLVMLFVGASAVAVGFHIFRSAKNSAM